MLIAGARGVVGRAALEAYEADHDWNICGLSRHHPEFPTRAGWIAADLLDPPALAKALSSKGPFTHIVYAALQEEASLVSGWTSQDQIDRNVAMLTNLLDALPKGLQHVTRRCHVNLRSGFCGIGRWA